MADGEVNSLNKYQEIATTQAFTVDQKPLAGERAIYFRNRVRQTNGEA